MIPAMSRILTDKLTPFLDIKDSGKLILTNIYLLVGMSLPLWISPHQASVYSSAQLQLYSGVISVGMIQILRIL